MDFIILLSGRWIGNVRTALMCIYIYTYMYGHNGHDVIPQIPSLSLVKRYGCHAYNCGGVELVTTSLASTVSATSTSLVALQVWFGTLFQLR